MARITAAGPPAKRPPHMLFAEVVLRSILMLLALAAIAACDRQTPAVSQGETNAATEAESAKGVDRSQAGKPAPDISFRDPDGGEFTLAEFEGQPVLANLWASWCAPCIKELPTLQRLEEAQAKDGQLAVIAVSQDMGPKTSVDAFLRGKQIGRFAAYHDPEMALSSALGVQIMPTTILYDAEGKEVWRYTGDLDWSGDEAAKLISEAG